MAVTRTYTDGMSGLHWPNPREVTPTSVDLNKHHVDNVDMSYVDKQPVIVLLEEQRSPRVPLARAAVLQAAHLVRVDLVIVLLRHTLARFVGHNLHLCVQQPPRLPDILIPRTLVTVPIHGDAPAGDNAHVISVIFISLCWQANGSNFLVELYLLRQGEYGDIPVLRVESYLGQGHILVRPGGVVPVVVPQ